MVAFWFSVILPLLLIAKFDENWFVVFSHIRNQLIGEVINVQRYAIALWISQFNHDLIPVAPLTAPL